MEQRKVPFVAGVNAVCTAIPGGSLAVSYKTKHVSTMRSGKGTPWHLPKGVENLCPHKTYTQMFIGCKVLTLPLKWYRVTESRLGVVVNVYCKL